MSIRLVVVSVVPLVAMSSIAVAQPVIRKETAPPPPPSVRVDVGVASPVGAVGVVYSRPLAPHFAVELGAGIGLSGVQLSVMGKPRFGSGRWRYTPGLGVSVGVPLGGTSAFHDGHPAGDHEIDGDPITMRWLDADVLGVEYRGPSGFVFAASGGVTVALNRAHWDVIDTGADVEAVDPSLQFRVGFGKTF